MREDKPDYGKLEKAVQLHQNALDEVVSMNSLYTAAVFVGLVVATPEAQNIEGKVHCEAGVDMARRLVKKEVLSFAFYLFSSLVAKALKTHLFIYLVNIPDQKDIISFTSKAVRVSMFALSTSTSIIGEVLLVLSMIDIVQLRLGKFACKVAETLQAVGILIAINTLALVIYIPLVAHAIFKSTKIFNKVKN